MKWRFKRFGDLFCDIRRIPEKILLCNISDWELDSKESHFSKEYFVVFTCQLKSELIY